MFRAKFLASTSLTTTLPVPSVAVNAQTAYFLLFLLNFLERERLIAVICANCPCIGALKRLPLAEEGSYLPSCREGEFSEGGLPVFSFLGNQVFGTWRSRKLMGQKEPGS